MLLKFQRNWGHKFTMKTVFPSPAAPSITTTPPLIWTFSTTSTAAASSLALPKNCLCSAPWWTSCSDVSDEASASSLSWQTGNKINSMSIKTSVGLQKCCSSSLEIIFKLMWVTDFHKQLLHSRPEILQHSFSKLLQVFQIWFSIHDTSPLT